MKRSLNKKDRLFKSASKAWDRGDTSTAFNLFQKAAESGDSSSQLNIGYFFDEGIYVQRDISKALYWYKKAFHKGSGGGAANNIAITYKAKHEYRKALWWFHRATNLLNHDAFYEIAQFYEKGLGVKHNKKKALYYYRKAQNSEYVTLHTEEISECAANKLVAELNALLRK